MAKFTDFINFLPFTDFLDIFQINQIFCKSVTDFFYKFVMSPLSTSSVIRTSLVELANIQIKLPRKSLNLYS